MVCEPRVERGFASGTLGSRTQKKNEAREAGGSQREPKRMLVEVLSESIAVARFAGCNHLFVWDPRVALAKPRFTLGFMLPPAPRAATRTLSLRLLACFESDLFACWSRLLSQSLKFIKHDLEVFIVR